MSKTVYIISGPTATGKSLIAYYLAKRINGEIVNCDSVQLYRYMDIGSAKPTTKDMQRIPHHLYSIIDPKDSMTVARYQELALKQIDEILSRGKVPIVCGGTGLYLNSILYDMSFGASPDDDKRRDELERLADERGSEYMYQYLEALDPDAASRIHPNNVRKVIRAIEAYEFGKGIGNLADVKLNPNYDFKFYALNMDRAWLYERINQRVVKLINEGLVREVASLIERGYGADLPAMKAIGYKEIISYLYGECDLQVATEEIKKNTRHYAKRQLTWLKRYDFVKWIDIKKGESVGEIVDSILNQNQESE